METDIRAPEEEVGILINLSADAGQGIEAKCLSVNPIFNEYLAVGASDAFIRMYDRRQMKYNVMKVCTQCGKFIIFLSFKFLREINFRDSKSEKSAIFTLLEAMHFDIYEFLHFLNGCNLPNKHNSTP